ncbi:MAG: hypothetical protein HQ596_03590, partial [Candidatus Saganbacteria bacterium]|nr:hypothetical protein [Candidatus Saganbacteria bacterium]
GEGEGEGEGAHLFKGTSLEKIVRQGLLKNHRITLRSKTKEEIPVMLSGSVLRDKSGELVGIVSIARDMRDVNRLIGDLEQSRSDLEKRKGELETRVKELSDSRSATIYMLKDLDRTEKELRQTLKDLRFTQAQLVQAGKLAGIGQLAAGVAHEINNPLTTAYGFLELLLEEDLALSTKKDLKKIRVALERCKDITARLLSFTRPAETKDLVLTDVNNTLKQTLSLMTSQLMHQNIELTQKLAPDLPEVLAIPAQLQQVYMNLIFNAQDAMPDGGELKIETRKTKVDQKEHVEIRISDTGMGIPAQNLERIFEPFFTTRRPGKGIGLGLSLSYAIIKEYSGSIEVESKVGEGTVFFINLPGLSSKQKRSNEKY